MKQYFFKAKSKAYCVVLLAVFFIIYSCKEKGDSQPKPVANFSTDSTTVYQGEKVIFNDESMYSPNYYEWHFLGGFPEYIKYSKSINDLNRMIATRYDIIGEYSVTLTVRNKYGESTITKNNYITVIEDPRPRMHGKVLGVERVSYISVEGKYLNEEVSLGGTLDIIEGNRFELRIPVKYLGKTLNLCCYYGSSDIDLYRTKYIDVTITKETYVDFPL